MNSVLKDPFDEDRDYACNLFKKRIPYLRKMDEHFLKLLYYKSSEYYYAIHEQIFRWDEQCEFIYIVTQGVVSIDLTNGTNSEILDLLGRGSIIGIHNILYPKSIWYLNCTARSALTTKVLKVSKVVLKGLSMTYPYLFELIEDFKHQIEMIGNPQIDYLKHNEKLFTPRDYPSMF